MKSGQQVQWWSGTSQVLSPVTNEDEDDNVVVTDDADEKQLQHGEVLTRGRLVGRVSGHSLLVSSKRCLTSSHP